MEDELIGILESLGYPVYRQGCMLTDEEYPPTFLTFWNNTEYENSAYDNKTAGVVYDYDVNVYSNNPDTVYTMLNIVRDNLKANGFIIPDRGHDVASDYATHSGRGLNTIYLS